MNTECGTIEVPLARSLSVGRRVAIRLEWTEERTGGVEMKTVNTDKSFQWFYCEGKQRNGPVGRGGHGVGEERTNSF